MHVKYCAANAATMVCAGKSSRSGQKWRAKEESIRNNLRQYGHGQLYLDVLVADASRHQLWRQGTELLGAIIADRKLFNYYK